MADEKPQEVVKPKIWTALLAAQKELKNAPKDSKNPHFKNDYASLESVLETVKPVLHKHGLVLVQACMQGKEPGVVVIRTTIVHAETGENISDDLPIPLAKSDPQGVGSAITYGRRYGLQAMTGISSEDDDGEAQRIISVPKGAKVEVVNFDKPVDPSNQAAPSEQVKAMQNKLGSALGFKPKS